MNAKIKPAVKAASDIRTEKDAAYQFAVLRDSGREIVSWMLDKHPDFGDTVSDTLKAQLLDGFTVRFNENHGENVYTTGDMGSMVLVGNTVKALAVNGKVLPVVKELPKNSAKYGIYQVQGYSPQELGMLKSKEPALHSVLSPINIAFRKYASNALGDMQRMARKILDERAGKTATRQMVLFVDSMTKQFDAWEKQVKNAEKREDATADAVKYRMAREAFFKTYNTK